MAVAFPPELQRDTEIVQAHDEGRRTGRRPGDDVLQDLDRPVQVARRSYSVPGIGSAVGAALPGLGQQARGEVRADARAVGGSGRPVGEGTLVQVDGGVEISRGARPLIAVGECVSVVVQVDWRVG